MNRAMVPISKEHRGRLAEIAKRSRRSMTGQVEYMIDQWTKLANIGVQVEGNIVFVDSQENVVNLPKRA